MEKREIEQRVSASFPEARMFVEGEGCDFSLVVVCPSFTGQSIVQKQKRVLATVSDLLASGELHAMTVKAFTPEEWTLKQQNDGSNGLVVLS